VVNLRYASLLMMLTIAACAARAAAPVAVAPRASRAVLDTKAVTWSARDPKIELIPAHVRNLQLVVTRGRVANERFAWLISNGTDVIRVYHATSNAEAADIVAELGKMVFPTVAHPGDDIEWGGTGSVHAPGPAPPGPPGFPDAYVQQVMDIAWGMHRQQVQHGAEVGAPVH